MSKTKSQGANLVASASAMSTKAKETVKQLATTEDAALLPAPAQEAMVEPTKPAESAAAAPGDPEPEVLAQGNVAESSHLVVDNLSTRVAPAVTEDGQPSTRETITPSVVPPPPSSESVTPEPVPLPAVQPEALSPESEPTPALQPEQPEPMPEPVADELPEVTAAREKANRLLSEFQGNHDFRRRDAEILAEFQGDPKLYRALGCSTFEELAEQVFHLSRDWAYKKLRWLRLIKTWEFLSGRRYTPSCRFEFKEAEARFFGKLWDHPEEFMRALQEADEDAAKEGKKRNSGHVHRACKRQEAWLETKETEAKEKTGRDVTYVEFRAWYDSLSTIFVTDKEIDLNEAEAEGGIIAYCRNKQVIPTRESLLAAVRGKEFMTLCGDLAKLADELAETQADAKEEAELEEAEADAREKLDEARRKQAERKVKKTGKVETLADLEATMKTAVGAEDYEECARLKVLIAATKVDKPADPTTGDKPSQPEPEPEQADWPDIAISGEHPADDFAGFAVMMIEAAKHAEVKNPEAVLKAVNALMDSGNELRRKLLTLAVKPRYLPAEDDDEEEASE